MRMHQFVVASIVTLAFSVGIAFAGGSTALTYQGRLLDAGEPANGTFSVDFGLWDDPFVGSQIGSTVTFISLPISDGLFTVEIDFGANAFENSGRWLEISVDGVPLTPRQPITRAPYSIQTRGIYVDADEHVGIGTTSPQAALHATSDELIDTIFAYSENRSAVIGRSNYVNGVGIWGRNDISNNLGYLGSTQYGVYGQAADVTNDWAGYFVGRAHVSERLFVGREDPIINTEYFGFNAPVGDGQFGGMYISTDGQGAKPFYGYAAGGNIDMWHYYDGTTGSWHLYNVGERLTVQSNGNVGIGPTAPEYPLHVVSAGPAPIFGWNTATSGVANGVLGQSSSTIGRGVIGLASAFSGVTYGVYGQTFSSNGYGVFSFGDFGGNGAKYFIQPHPYDPSKEIRFVCLEGNESGTYFRGSTRLVAGRAVIDVPEEFRLVTEADALTVQVTAKGPNAGLWVETETLDQIVVRGNGNVQFNYFVNGVRRGFADLELIRENHGYVPKVRGVPYGTQYREGHRQILVENGILNADFTPNEATAAMMGWTLRDPEPDELSRAASSIKGESR